MSAILYPWQLSLFVALNIADWFLTWHLLQHGNGQAYESNPVANWCLSQFGWVGLGLFKLGAVLSCGVVVVAISAFRPETGRRILTVCCTLVAAVVLYSGLLVHRLEVDGDSEEELASIEQRQESMESERERNWTYSQLVMHLGDDLVARRCTLRDAAARLAETPKGHDAEWLRNLHEMYPGHSDLECLAANALEHAVASRRDNMWQVYRLIHRFNREFHHYFGTGAPCQYTAVFGQRLTPREG